MRKAFTSLACVAASLVCAAAALTLAPGAADASVRTRAALTNDQFYEIVATGANAGVYTAEQRAALLTRPDLAATTLDVTSAQVSEIATVSVAAATKTRHVDRYVHVPAFLHIGNGFEFHLSATWSYTGKKILSKPITTGYLKGAGEYPGVRVKSVKTANMWTRTNHFSMRTVITGIWAQCLPKVACVGGNGVEGTFGLYGNGAYTYKGKIKNI